MTTFTIDNDNIITAFTTPEEARGDVLLLHRIFRAIRRPLVG